MIESVTVRHAHSGSRQMKHNEWRCSQWVNNSWLILTVTYSQFSSLMSDLHLTESVTQSVSDSCSHSLAAEVIHSHSLQSLDCFTATLLSFKLLNAHHHLCTAVVSLHVTLQYTDSEYRLQSTVLHTSLITWLDFEVWVTGGGQADLFRE